jgi:pimeloyl-ACP methyl ester carboxylesterase
MRGDARTIGTNVGDLHVESRGQGPAVLCWPSLYCDGSTLTPLVDDLSRDYQVVVVDGPGHGGSGSSPGACSLDECADAAVQVMDALGIRRAVWIGAAWGGHIGVLAGRRHPGRMIGLVVLNAPMAPWRGRRLALMRLTYALLRVFGPRSFVARLVAEKMISPSAGPDRQAIVDVVVEALRRCDRHGLLRAARSAMFGRGDLRPVLPDVHVPVLFLTGAQDSLLPVDEARRQAAAIPECRFVVIERSAHQSVLESPPQVLPVVRAAIAEWVGRASLSSGRSDSMTTGTPATRVGA